MGPLESTEDGWVGLKPQNAGGTRERAKRAARRRMPYETVLHTSHARPGEVFGLEWRSADGDPSSSPRRGGLTNHRLRPGSRGGRPGLVPLQAGCPRAKPRLDTVPLPYLSDLEKAGRKWGMARSPFDMPSTPSRV
jgi:hypothetical protein